MANEQQKFQKIIDVSMEFGQAKDVDLLLEKILAAAVKFANADSGAIYIVDNEKLLFHHTQTQHIEASNRLEERRNYEAFLTPVDPISMAAYVVKSAKILNIPDVQQLPDDLSYSFIQSYPNQPGDQIYSVLCFPLRNNHSGVIGAIQLVNFQNDEQHIVPFSEDDIPLVQLFATNAANALERAKATRARVLGIIQILTALRDTEETVPHVNRIGLYASEIYESWARQKGISPSKIDSQKDVLRMAAMLHDVGKLAIPTVIRRKPGRLNEEEYETMKQHTIKGAQLLLKYAQSELEEIAAEIALNHHERWDGTGYPGHINPQTGEVIPGYEDSEGNPQGKKGGEIPLFGRVVAVADVYESLSNRRVYRDAWKEEDVLNELRKGSGTQFDPEMIDAFFSCFAKIREVGKRFPNS